MISYYLPTVGDVLYLLAQIGKWTVFIGPNWEKNSQSKMGNELFFIGWSKEGIYFISPKGKMNSIYWPKWTLFASPNWEMIISPNWEMVSIGPNWEIIIIPNWEMIPVYQSKLGNDLYVLALNGKWLLAHIGKWSWCIGPNWEMIWAVRILM